MSAIYHTNFMANAVHLGLIEVELYFFDLAVFSKSKGQNHLFGIVKLDRMTPDNVRLSRSGTHMVIFCI